MVDGPPAGAALRALQARIARRGPVPWSELVDVALYGDGGFYAAGGGAGRSRDFLTSVELGPLFGAVVANAIDDAWDRWGRPDPWLVIEGGGGAGTLAAAVLAAEPACAPALRYVVVETSPVLRAAAAARLPLEDPGQMLGPTVTRDGETTTTPGLGPLVTVIAELPAVHITGMVFANELLDNLPFDVYERSAAGWSEVRVGTTPEGSLVEVVVEAADATLTHLDELAPDAPVGARAPWQAAAATWVGRALELVERGRVVVIDYARPTAALAAAPVDAWLRTYRGGGPGIGPLADLGSQDITADVALDQLSLVHTPSRVDEQRAWLDRHGIDALTAAAETAWRGGAEGLEAMRARSRVNESAALRDQSGLGGFTVMEWDVRPPPRRVGSGGRA